MKLYVGNLPFGMTEQDLQALFEHYGQITEAAIIKDKFSGRSKGFGFVTIADDAAAQKAVSELNGKDVQGRAIVVNEARPMEPRAERSDRFERGSGGGFGRRNRY